MPIEPRPADVFTEKNLLLGFSKVEFTPRLTSGALGTTVEFGILNAEELQKEVTLLRLPDGAGGVLTTVREVVSDFDMQLQIGTFNWKADLAQYILGSESITLVSANPTEAVTDDPINLPGANPFTSFITLTNADIAESSVAVECATVTDEAVGTGDGVANDFVLDYKVKAVADANVGDGIRLIDSSGTVTSYTAVAVNAAAAGNQVEVVVGEADGAHPTTSGSLEFFVGGVTTPPASGSRVVATYKPSFTTAAGDIVNATADPVETGRTEASSMTFASPGGANDTVTHAGTFISDGFKVGDFVIFEGTTSNDALYGPILALSETVMEFAEGTVTGEGPVSTDAHGFDVFGDFVVDPYLGRIRFVDPSGPDNSPFRTTGDEQPLLVDYTYNRKAGATFKPGTQREFNGVARIRHLPDIGINFIWDVPSAQIQLTDDPVTFDTANFATATLALNILDAGGTDRFGTITRWASETEAAS